MNQILSLQFFQKISLIFSLILFLTLSCKQKPAIKSEPFEKVLWDYLTAQNTATIIANNKQLNKDSLTRIYEEAAFKKNKTTRGEFEQSLAYYKTHPKTFNAIIDSALKGQNTINLYPQNVMPQPRKIDDALPQ